jgi:predicted ATPase
LAEELGVAPSPTIRGRHDELLALDDAVAERPAPTRSGTGHIRVDLPPRPVSTLFGRETDLRRVADRLTSARAVTLVGPGGVGKTRLATEVAHRIADRFDDGVVFCDLTALPADSASEAVGEALATAVGIEPRAGASPEHRLTEVLRHTRVLVVLDNCEHVLDGAAEQVERLLRTTEALSVLATSRERLAVDGEHLCPVEPLPCDDGESNGASPAHQLFADRARAAGYDLDPYDPMVVALCRRLDGLPLAIELAASRLTTLTLHEIASGLEHSMSLLRGGRRTAPRHRTLEAALDWSFRLLDPSEMRALHGAAIFAGTFDGADLAAVVDDDPFDVREELAALVERSIVLRVGDRHRLLEPVRAHVRERIDPATHDELLRRHARRVVARLAEASADLRTASGDAPTALARRLVPDLRHARATVMHDRDVDVAVALVVHGRDLALDGMLPEVLTWGEEVAVLAADADHPLTADCYAIAAIGRWKTGDLEAMRRLLTCATAEARRLGVVDRYEVLGALGTEDLAHGDLRRAGDRLARSLQAAEATTDVHRLAEGGATLAIVQAYAHEADAASTVRWLLDEVEPRAGSAPRAWCWYAAGECAMDDEPELARERLERAVAYARRAGASFVEGVAGASLASLAVRQGRLHDAVADYRWLLPHWVRAGVATPFWTMMRSVDELLVAAGVDEPAAVLLGAVTAPEAGNDVIGDDDVRLRSADATLRERLGSERVDELLTIGRSYDDAAAAEEATAAFELVC